MDDGRPTTIAGPVRGGARSSRQARDLEGTVVSVDAVLRLCVDIAHSDGTVDISESIIISSALEQSGLHREIFRPAD